MDGLLLSPYLLLSFDKETVHPPGRVGGSYNLLMLFRKHIHFNFDAIDKRENMDRLFICYLIFKQKYALLSLLQV